MFFRYAIIIISIMCSASISAMEQMTQQFQKMEIKEQSNKSITLVGIEGKAVTLDYPIAMLSPRLKKIIDEHKEDSTWDGVVQCPHIAGDELATIKQALETMHHYGIPSNDGVAISEQAMCQLGLQLFPLVETLRPNAKKRFFKRKRTQKNNRLAERYDAAKYFELPLLQDVLNREAKKELKGQRHLDLEQLPKDVWNIILANVAQSDAWKATMQRLLTTAKANIPTSHHPAQHANAAICTLNGKLMATRHTNGDVTVWDANTHQVLNKIINTESISSDTPVFLTFSPKGDKFAIGLGANVKILDTKTWGIIATLSHDTTVQHVTFSPSGESLAIGGNDFIHIYKTSSLNEKCIKMKVPENNKLISMVFSPDDNWFAILRHSHQGNQQACVDLWDWQNKKRVKVWSSAPRSLHTCDAHVASIAFDPNDSYFVIGGNKGIHLIDMLTWNVISTLPSDYVCPIIMFSPNGRWLVERNRVPKSHIMNSTIWDMSTFEKFTSLATDYSSLSHSMAFANNDQLAVIHEKGPITVFDLSIFNYKNQVFTYEQFMLLNQLFGSQSGKKAAPLKQLQELTWGDQQTLIDSLVPSNKCSIQ